MQLESSVCRTQSKRSLIMKVGSAVFVVHIAVVCVFSLTQGCITSESQGSGRGAGARRKGPWKHEYKNSTATEQMGLGQDSFDMGMQSGMEPMFTPVDIGTAPLAEPNVGAASMDKTEVYIVKKGDILSQLAVDFDTTTAELVRLNNLADPDVLYVGQELRVPAGRMGPKSSTSKSTTSVHKGSTYTIQKGDTLSGIALAAGVSINDLRTLNNITGDKIMAGNTLDIPSYGKLPTNTQKTTTSKPKASTPTTNVIEKGPAAPEPELPAMAEPEVAEPSVAVVEPPPSFELDTVEERIVYPGETLDDIAREYSVTKAEIMRLNGIADENENLEGRRLRIPISE